MPSLLSLLAVSASVVLAQDYSVPAGSWKYDDTPFQKTQRVQIAQRGINQLLSYGHSDPGNVGGLGWWPSANVWSTIALADLWGGTTTYQSTVINAITTAYNNNNKPFRYTDYNDDTLWWINAALYSYSVYGSAANANLQQAEAGWTTVNQWMITAAQASSNTSPKGTIDGTCNGFTMAGGVFWNAESGNMYTNSITTNLFALASSYLYKFTGDSKYSAAAKLSLTWLTNHAITGDNLILDGVTSNTCGLSTAYYTYNQGMYLGAVSIYQWATGDTQFNGRAGYVLSATTHTTSHFQGTNGVITEGEGTSPSDGSYFRGAYLRGLALMYNYLGGSPSSAMNILIHAYVDDQYSSMINSDSDDASGKNTHLYGPTWNGPYVASQVGAYSMEPACDCLAAAILTNNNGQGSGFRLKHKARKEHLLRADSF